MKSLFKSKTSGFTLVELLVVILIIGVLAAVALPVYQTAVNKSRYAGLMSLARSVKEAEEEVKMKTGSYTALLSDLSIQVPGTPAGDDKSATNNDGVKVELYSEGEHDFVKASRTNLPNTYVMYFAKSPTFAGEIHCEAIKDGDGNVNKRAKQLCESLGGTQIATQIGTDSNYVAYVLQGTGIGTGSGVPQGNCASGACYNGSDMDQSTYDKFEEFFPQFASYFGLSGEADSLVVRDANSLCTDNNYTDCIYYYLEDYEDNFFYRNRNCHCSEFCMCRTLMF